MQFFSVHCLSCHNLDTLPRLNADEIPFCSQCSSTSNLAPEPLQKLPQQEQQQQMTDTEDDFLAALFSRNLYLSNQQQQQAARDLYLASQQQQQQQQQQRHYPPTPPAVSPTATNFSVSQHYNHSTHYQAVPPSPPQPFPASDDDDMEDDPASAQLLYEQQFQQQQQLQLQQQQLFQEHQQQQFQLQQQQQQQQKQSQADREYAEYLMSSDLSSPTSQTELAIALAHGIISNDEYQRSVDEYSQKSQKVIALKEDCSAMEMLAAAKRKDAASAPIYRTCEWFNDYYGGIDASYLEEDEDSPCSVYTGAGGCRLKPFDL